MRSYSAKRRSFSPSLASASLEDRKAPSSIGVVQNVVAPVSLAMSLASSTASATVGSHANQEASPNNSVTQPTTASVTGSLHVTQNLTGPGSSIGNSATQRAAAVASSMTEQVASPTSSVSQPTTAQVSYSAGVKQTVAGGQSQITNISTQNAHASFDSSITQNASPVNSETQTVSATVS
ncbi:MAG: hypothetical protein JO034_00740 [Singulisphaera sp.]|nr:hypothetical protein [Singulisphaera sp.]